MLRSPFLKILCLLLASSGGLILHAQVNTASLSGLATDSTGAALPHITVMAKDDANGYTRSAKRFLGSLLVSRSTHWPVQGHGDRTWI